MYTSRRVTLLCLAWHPQRSLMKLCAFAHRMPHSVTCTDLDLSGPCSWCASCAHESRPLMCNRSKTSAGQRVSTASSMQPGSRADRAELIIVYHTVSTLKTCEHFRGCFNMRHSKILRRTQAYTSAASTDHTVHSAAPQALNPICAQSAASRCPAQSRRGA
jgi:hypothetical protein